jgi:hypothetical protein
LVPIPAKTLKPLPKVKVKIVVKPIKTGFCDLIVQHRLDSLEAMKYAVLSPVFRKTSPLLKKP